MQAHDPQIQLIRGARSADGTQVWYYTLGVESDSKIEFRPTALELFRRQLKAKTWNGSLEKRMQEVVNDQVEARGKELTKSRRGRPKTRIDNPKKAGDAASVNIEPPEQVTSAASLYNYPDTVVATSDDITAFSTNVDELLQTVDGFYCWSDDKKCLRRADED